MNILMTGGTGFIGQHLIRRRLALGDKVYCLTRNVERVNALFQNKVEGVRALSELEGQRMDAVINLAGEPILDKRWSDDRKQLIYQSRVGLTTDLVEWIGRHASKPRVLVSGSAIGYYGSHSAETLEEDSTCHAGFTHTLCADWERAALNATDLGVRVCVLRTGIVLGEGGALAKMVLPFKLGLGGPIGDGQQWMSWIHIDDEVNIIEMLMLQDQHEGAFNLTAPDAVTNRVFSKTLGAVLHRPTFMPMPSTLMKLILGEGATLLVEGQKVTPANVLATGYEFKYPELKTALMSILTD